MPVSAGTHTFVFAIGHVMDPDYESGLLVDDIMFIPGHQGVGTDGDPKRCR